MSNAIGGEGLPMLGVIDKPGKLELEMLSRCLRDWRLTLDLGASSATVFLYDWFLTSGDELAYLSGWCWDRSVFVRVLFLLVRYPTLVSTIMNLLPPTVILSNVAMCLRTVTIVCSELILATRTWVIWGKSRRILVFLVVFTIACTAVGVTMIVIGLATTTTTYVVPPVALRNIQPCLVLTSTLKDGWIVIYIDIIVYEAVVLALTLYGAIHCFQDTQTRRSKLFHILWIDGVIYFVFMLVLSIFNVVLLAQISGPQVQVRGGQVQTVFHSILSARVVLHISSTLKRDPLDSQSSTLVNHSYSANVVSADPSDA